MFFIVFVTFCSGIMSANFWESNDSGNKTLNYSVRNNKLDSHTNKFSQLHKNLTAVAFKIQQLNNDIFRFKKDVATKEKIRQTLNMRNQQFTERFQQLGITISKLSDDIKELTKDRKIFSQRAENIHNTKKLSDLQEYLKSCKSKSQNRQECNDQEKKQLVHHFLQKFGARIWFVNNRKTNNKKAGVRKNSKDQKESEQDRVSSNLSNIQRNLQKTNNSLKSLQELLTIYSESLESFEIKKADLGKDLETVFNEIAEA